MPPYNNFAASLVIKNALIHGSHPLQEAAIEAVPEKPEVDIQLHDLFPEIYQLPLVPHMQQPAGFENSMPEFQWRVVQNNKVDLVGPEYRVEDADQLEKFFRLVAACSGVSK